MRVQRGNGVARVVMPIWEVRKYHKFGDPRLSEMSEIQLLMNSLLQVKTRALAGLRPYSILVISWGKTCRHKK